MKYIEQWLKDWGLKYPLLSTSLKVAVEKEIEESLKELKGTNENRLCKSSSGRE